MRPSVETMGAAVRRVLDAVDAGHAVLLTLRPLQQARAASAPPSRDDDGPLGAGGGGRIRPGGDLPDVACLLLPLADRNGRPTHVIGALALDSWPAAAQASGFRVIDHVVAPAGLFQRAGTGADPRGAAQENAAAMPETRVPAAPPTAPFSTTLPATPLPAYAGARNPPAAPAASDVTTFGPGPTDTGPTGAGPTGAGATGADQDAFAESDRPWIGAPISAGGRTRLRLIRGGRRDQDTDADSRRKDA